MYVDELKRHNKEMLSRVDFISLEARVMSQIYQLMSPTAVLPDAATALGPVGSTIGVRTGRRSP